MSKQDLLIKDTSRFSCLEMPGDDGFTLLQSAVSCGDLQMVSLLVDKLGASVNEYGNTCGWTPLLLACQGGYFSIAQFLVDRKAYIKCRASDGESILHTIHHFTSREHCEAVVKWGLAAGLDINCQLRNQMTPLHATFVGWDYSDGAAADILIQHGADPTSTAKEFDGHFNKISPIGMCAVRLNNKLLQRMIDAAAQISGTEKRIALCKAQALSSMGRKTRFYYMTIGGEGYKARMAAVLNLLIDIDVAAYFKQGTTNLGLDNLLYFAVSYSRDDFVESLLIACPGIDVNAIAQEEQETGSFNRPCIQLSIERSSLEAARILVKHGADLLLQDPRDYNALHAAAHYFPDILLELVEAVEKLPLNKRGHRAMKEILEETNSERLTVFGVLVLEGYDREIAIAEILRKRYGLEYDYRVIKADKNENWITLCGLLIHLAVNTNLLSVEQIYYLLNLNPRPQFICNSNGETLLTKAMGLTSYQRSNNVPSHQLVAKILEIYGSYENLLLGPGDGTSFHIAASYANQKALEMMANFIITRFPDKKIPWNKKITIGDTKATSLDLLQHEAGNAKLASNGWLPSDGVVLKTIKAAAIECYKYLHPYMRIEYEHEINGHATTTRWTRGGQVWTENEVNTLIRRFSEMWQDYFGEPEEIIWEGLIKKAEERSGREKWKRN
ncbi:hypothetical protein ABW20_dc0108296 [Dactylellina cionopaga]|nr:hypothetical protein ABW20_dc0108296 [Dactylellina cionopaga]